MAPIVHVIAPVSLAAFLLVLLRFAFSKRLLRPSPPLPADYQEKTFAEWTQQFGDVVFAKIFRRPVLVLGSLRAAQDLLEKKSGNFSDRPRLILLSELMGWDNVITHMRYGDRFRKHRRWMHDNFQTKSALDGYRPIQRRETYTLLAGLLETPADFLSLINRWSTGMIMDITYGHRISSLQDKYVKLAHDATAATVLAGSPGSMLVDFFPVLKNLPTWMPGAGFKREAFRIRDLVRAMMDTPYEMVRGAMAAGTARPSFTASLLEETYHRNGPSTEEADDIKGAAGVIYGAGTETTVTVMSNFILAMVLHPEAFKRVQQEIDSVVGRSRLPDFDDRENLPYLDCVLSEVAVSRPLGIPHNAMEDDGYRGYHIPANTMVIPNMWCAPLCTRPRAKMTQDPAHFPEPQAFLPERFLDRQTAEACNPRKIVFGFGRRLCPGREFAEASIWLAAASVISMFDVAKAVDQWGNEITPAGDYVSGFVSQPKPFVCSFQPRTEKAVAADIIAQARTALTI
ncbi:cytochrome P450 [Daedaleopsis nitida]|nr:cytochrome P450 [Daedaleopsis nitida]